MNLLWFIPTFGDGRYPGSVRGARETNAGYLRQIAEAVDSLGYYGALLPTGAALGIETFILSGYPHLEEAYRVAELLFPLLPFDHAPQQVVSSYVGPFGDLKPAER
jgi:hypothetical protein